MKLKGIACVNKNMEISNVFQRWQATGLGKNFNFWVEIICLAVAFPFLLFPFLFSLGTIAVLTILVGNWLFAFFHHPPIRLSSPFSLLVILFGGWSIVGILVTADPLLTTEKAAGLLLGIATWRFVILYLKNEPAFNLLLSGYLALGSGFVAVGFFAVDWLDKVPAISLVTNLLPQQVLSLTAIGSGNGVQPNQLAGTTLWLFPVAFALAAMWFTHKRYLIASLSLLIGIASAFILVLSQSRGGWLGGISALALYFWLVAFVLPKDHWYRPMRIIGPSLAILAITSTIIIIGPTQLLNIWLDPPDTTLVGDLGTLSFRQEVWTWGLQAIQDFAFTGTGLGSFRQVVHRLYPIAIPVTYDIAHAHNVFLQIALDIGLPGLVFYCGIITLYFCVGWQIIQTSSSWSWVSIGLISAQFGFHIYGLVDAITIGSKPSLLFWLLLASMSHLWVLAQGQLPQSKSILRI